MKPPVPFTILSAGTLLAILATDFPLFAQSTPAAAVPAPVTLTAQQDHERIMELLGMSTIRPGKDGNNRNSPNYANYDESKANPYPNLPDPLTFKNGQKVNTAEQWWNQRRPEIVEDFDREVYGRVPKETPKVTWEVTSTNNQTVNNVPVVVQQIVGHVDNTAYPAITVNIGLTLTVPANATGPVPVMMVFGGGFGGGFGGPRGGRGPGGPGGAGGGGGPGRGPATAPGGGAGGTGGGGADAGNPFEEYFVAVPGAPGGAGGRAGGAGPGRGPGGAAGWQQTAISKGWGYASLNTGSIQADNGGGLTQGIIGLCNKGQPRKLEDWGVLRAWAWGASRALDYFETDKSVDARQVGLEGHSRWGKATIVAMAYDQRFAIAYVSSSGEGGAKLHRRNWGEIVENVAGTGEYHWMAGNFLKYAGPKTWDDLPVDSHELVALCAPRPVLITGGVTEGDGWVDARGMFMAAAAAGPVYKLLGKKDLGTMEFPPTETALIDGDVAFRQHNGGHTDALNWPTFFTFADRYIKAPPLAK